VERTREFVVMEVLVAAREDRELGCRAREG